MEEQLDTTSTAGELVFHVFRAIAHFEGRLIAKRTRDSIAAGRKRGKTPGRPKFDDETTLAAQHIDGWRVGPRTSRKAVRDRPFNALPNSSECRVNDRLGAQSDSTNKPSDDADNTLAKSFLKMLKVEHVQR
ncbi:MAG: hypothetical protein ACI8PT_004131 [Gammaproteobacteria bacterium]